MSDHYAEYVDFLTILHNIVVIFTNVEFHRLNGLLLFEMFRKAHIDLVDARLREASLTFPYHVDEGKRMGAAPYLISSDFLWFSFFARASRPFSQ